MSATQIELIPLGNIGMLIVLLNSSCSEGSASGKLTQLTQGIVETHVLLTWKSQ